MSYMILSVAVWVVTLSAVGVFVWVASIVNMSADLGVVAWLTPGIYPLLVSIAVGLVMLCRASPDETGRNGSPSL